jgi:hypothetical protein
MLGSPGKSAKLGFRKTPKRTFLEDPRLFHVISIFEFDPQAGVSHASVASADSKARRFLEKPNQHRSSGVLKMARPIRSRETENPFEEIPQCP